MTYEDAQIRPEISYEMRLASLLRNSHRLAERAVDNSVVLSTWMPNSGWLDAFYDDWGAVGRDVAKVEPSLDVPSGRGEYRTFMSDYGILRETRDRITAVARVEVLQYFGQTAVEQISA